MLPDHSHIRAAVKDIIRSVKELDAGISEIRDDVLLFDSDEGEPSPIGLDSLDGLDLALALADRFQLELDEDADLRSLRTVNDIVDFVVSRTAPDGGTEPVPTREPVANDPQPISSERR